MCLSPILIKNPNFGMHGNVSASKLKLDFTRGLGFLTDTTSAYIRVPCGRCPQCIALRQSYYVQRSQCEEMSNDLYFCTLTYNNEMIPFLDASDGTRLYYADMRDVTNMMKRLRKNDSFGMPFKYFAVSEYGSLKHRPHFHIIFSFPRIKGESLADRLSRAQQFGKIVLNEWKRNVATCVNKKGEIVPNTRSPRYVNLCTFKTSRRGRNFDFHYVNPSSTDKGSADVAFYVTKYTFKADEWYNKLSYKLYKTLEEEEYYDIREKIKPRSFFSKSWGSADDELVKKHIRKGVELSNSGNIEFTFPVFINPVTGQTFPLSPFYRKKFDTIDDAVNRYYIHDNDRCLTDYDSMIAFEDDLSVEQRAEKYRKHDRIIKKINARLSGGIAEDDLE